MSARLARLRLAAGLLQGVCLCWLYSAAKGGLDAPSWPADQPYLFASLLFLGVLAPVLLMVSLGHMKATHVAAWLGAATLIMVGLACHDIWRGGADADLWFLGTAMDGGRYPSAKLFLFTTAGFFIAHTLVQAAVQDGRRLAAYNSYFEAAWTFALQLMFSLFFVGLQWLILLMGTLLFGLVGSGVLEQLMRQPWFAIPFSCCGFSCAMHVTDVRPAIVRNIRGLLLVLMSWVLPMTALLVAVFLLSLSLTGLASLWATRSATAVLLGADVVLVIFINAAFQNGDAAASVARLVRLSARLAAVLLAPITAIAMYALSLRVAEHGWTSDRITAACCLLVAASYACGYGWAACQRGAWLAPLARVNVMTSWLILAILLALFSPVADPARLSVDQQMASFTAGKIAAEDLDMDYLRFEGARYGRAALQRLQAGAQGPDAALLRERAAHVLAKKNRWEPEEIQEEGPVDLAVNLKLQPAGAQLPPSFLRERWTERTGYISWPACLTQRGAQCLAFILGPDGDGRAQVMLMGDLKHPSGGVVLLAETADGHWRRVGQLPDTLALCTPFQRQLAAGQFSWIAPPTRDLQINGVRMHLRPDPEPEPDPDGALKLCGLRK